MTETAIRKNLCVISKTTEDGQIIPMSIIWEDGREFKIRKNLDVRRVASLKTGGCGTRYTCQIGNKTVYLFKDDDIWYMEVDK